MVWIVLAAAATALGASNYGAVTPLWNSTVIVQPTFFQPVKTTLEVTNTHGNSGYSVECLGCHDGVNAKNAFITRRMSLSRENMMIRSLAGSPKQHHPVNIVYVEGKAGLKAVNSVLKGVWKGNVTTIADILVNGRVECSTCHLEPHVIDPDTQTLRHSNAKSILCTSCHDK